MKSKSSASKYILVGLLVIAQALLSGCAAQQNKAETPNKGQEATEEKREGPEASEAKQMLVDGNARFVSGNVPAKDISEARRTELAEKGQKPFAIVLTCSDSRVPPELIFDQGLGNIFVIRTAGNVVDPVAIGSIEYGAEHLKAPLIVVMGHESCGAVKATILGGTAPGSIGAIIAKIKPSVDKVKAAGATGIDLPVAAENENVKEVIAELDKSPVVKELAEKGELTVVGAKYHLGSGEVEWLK